MRGSVFVTVKIAILWRPRTADVPFALKLSESLLLTVKKKCLHPPKKNVRDVDSDDLCGHTAAFITYGPSCWFELPPYEAAIIIMIQMPVIMVINMPALGGAGQIPSWENGCISQGMAGRIWCGASRAVVVSRRNRWAFQCALWSSAVHPELLSKFRMGAQLIPARNAALLVAWLPPHVFLEETGCDFLLLSCTKESSFTTVGRY